MKLIAFIIIAFCSYIAVSGVYMVLNLKESVDGMQNSRKQSYPENELPVQLRKDPTVDSVPKGMIPWKNGENVSEHPGRLRLDIEEEKCYPYYLRTCNVLSNVFAYTDQQLQDGSWYGYDEWLQDMTANKVAEDILSGSR